MSNGRDEGELGDVDVLQGVPPGSHINDVSVLDLRMVPAEEVAKINEMNDVSVLLLSEDNRNALRGAHINDVNVIMVAEPDESVLVAPQVEITRAMLEAAPGGSRMLVVGNLFIKPQVPAGLMAEKFESIRVVGIVMACEGVFGAMLGKLQTTSGPTIVLPDDTGHVVRSLSDTTVIAEYLAELPDDTTFVSISETRFSPAISPDLLRQKIRAYHSLGCTKGPASLIGILRARCLNDTGEFKVTDKSE
jgi:hypothetical protein